MDTMRVNKNTSSSGAARSKPRHLINFVLFGLPSDATVRLDIPFESGAWIEMLPWSPAFQLGASYGDAAMVLRDLTIQPQRLQLQIENAPRELPLTVQVCCDREFLFGWLQVPDNVQIAVVSAAQAMRVVGATFWAIPLIVPRAAAALATPVASTVPEPVPATS